MSSTSTTLSNVKISQLEPLKLADLNNNAYIAIPISKENDDKKTWSSYRIGLEHLSKLIDNNTTLTTVSETANNAETVAYRAERRSNDAYSAIDPVDRNITYISQSLAKYNSYFNHKYQLTKSSTSQYINTNGEVVSSGDTHNCYIYDCDYTLQAGDLCSVYIGSGWLDQIPNAYISIVSKVHKKNNTYTYEPLPRQYYVYDSAHYVFFANEDMKVKFSLPSESVVSSEGLTVYKYGAFKELGNALLGVNSELMKVLVEAITKNRKDIESLYESIKSPGDISVSSIECDDFPSVQGEPMVVVKNRKPTYDSAYFGPEYPNRIGQIWVNTADGTAYIATKLGNGWRQMTLGTAF